MKTLVRLVVYQTTMCAALSSCSTSSQFTGPVSFLPDTELANRWITVKRTSTGLLFKGQVRSLHGYPGRLHGHLHIEALDARRIAIATTDARWGEFLSRQFFSAYYKAAMPLDTSKSVSEIRIAFQREDKP